MAVNAKPDVADTLRRIYDAISALEHKAGVYTNVSQLRLVLRGLESENAVTRIASMHQSQKILN